MDKRYENGKIYTIRCRYDDNLIYVGSTVENYLSNRMSKHRYLTSCNLSKYVNGDWDNWYIELYENYPCDNREQLSKREGEIIRQIGTLNKRIEGRTKKEYQQYNREKIKEQRKQNYEDNRDKQLEQMKKYREDNREKLSEYRKKQITCERCDSIVKKTNITRHQKTKKCLNYNIINN